MTTFDLQAAAWRVMREAGLEPEIPPAAQAEARAATAAADAAAPARDLRDRLWSSIDNDSSRDLDQLEWAEALGGGRARLLLAIADVDVLVPAGSNGDQHARRNTTSVYGGVTTFPMLAVALSEDRTSLHQGQDRAAMVVELTVEPDGSVSGSEAYRALVRNQVRLSYDDLGAWLEGRGPAPAEVAAAGAALEAQLRLQDQIARQLQARRQERGALELETVEARPRVDERGAVSGLELTPKNRARSLIEDLMLAANSATADILERAGRSWLRRTVRAPRRWDRLLAVAREHGEELPQAPNAPALAAFLKRRRAAAPERFAELSLTVVKLIGPGSYEVERSGEDLEAHFALAVEGYTHSTAPNRRYADLVTQRLLKAALDGRPSPYPDDELAAIAGECTRKADAARRVERRLRKMAAAVLLAPRLGDVFDAVVTGAKPEGTYARLLAPPAEGRIVRGERGLDVGDRVRVRLERTDPEVGFIDFAVAER
jgi:VacB/RNase II family 3'-5' exoribonuclease